MIEEKEKTIPLSPAGSRANTLHPIFTDVPNHSVATQNKTKQPLLPKEASNQHFPSNGFNINLQALGLFLAVGGTAVAVAFIILSGGLGIAAAVTGLGLFAARTHRIANADEQHSNTCRT